MTKPSHLSPISRGGAVAKEQRRRCLVVVVLFVPVALVVPGRPLLGVEALPCLGRVANIYGSRGSSGGAFVVIVAGVRKLILQHQS